MCSTSVKELDQELNDIILTSRESLERLDVTKRLDEALEPVRDRASIHLSTAAIVEDGSNDVALEVRNAVKVTMLKLGSKLLGSHGMETPFMVELLDLGPPDSRLTDVGESNVDDTTRSQLGENWPTKGVELTMLQIKVSKQCNLDGTKKTYIENLGNGNAREVTGDTFDGKGTVAVVLIKLSNFTEHRRRIAHDWSLANWTKVASLVCVSIASTWSIRLGSGSKVAHAGAGWFRHEARGTTDSTESTIVHHSGGSEARCSGREVHSHTRARNRSERI